MFQLVKASAGDAETLARVQARAFAEDAEQYGEGPPGYDSVAWQIEAMEQSAYYAILFGDRIVGGILVNDKGDGHYYVHRLFVDPDFHNQGAASQALAFIEQTFPAKVLTLHTPYQSYGNQRFYEKRGYMKIGEERLDGPNLSEGFVLFLYEKRMPDIPPTPHHPVGKPL